MNAIDTIPTPDGDGVNLERVTDSAPSTKIDEGVDGFYYPRSASNMDAHYGAGPAIKAEEVSMREGTVDPVAVREFMKRYGYGEF
jgi:hypothetical protein